MRYQKGAKISGKCVLKNLDLTNIYAFLILNNFIIYARIPKEWGRYCFHMCLFTFRRGAPIQLTGGGGVTSFLFNWGYSFLSDGGVSPIFHDGGYPNARSGWGGYPYPRSEWGVQYSITCYALGGMPLAFAQEDFLVCIQFNFVEYNLCTFETLIGIKRFRLIFTHLNLANPHIYQQMKKRPDSQCRWLWCFCFPLKNPQGNAQLGFS